MTINKFNYESYAMDYLEGTLSPELKTEMEAFLKANPNIKAELAILADYPVFVPDESIVFEDKESLLKREENRLGLQITWFKPLLAAASIALLLITYRIGYKNGQIIESKEQLVHTPIQPSMNKSRKTEEGQINNSVKPSIEDISSNQRSKLLTSSPRKTEKKTIKLKRNLPILETSMPKSKMKDFVASSDNMQDVSSSSDIMNKAEKHIASFNPKLEELPKLAARPSKNQAQLSTSQLEEDLRKSIQISPTLLAVNTSKKLKLRDLLGKFPAREFKDVLVPNFYKEEVIGK